MVSKQLLETDRYGAGVEKAGTGAKLSEAQQYWLEEIAWPSGDAPFPPLNSLKVLFRLGMIEAFSDPDDVFAKMTGAMALRATLKGRAWLSVNSERAKSTLTTGGTHD